MKRIEMIGLCMIVVVATAAPAFAGNCTASWTPPQVACITQTTPGAPHGPAPTAYNYGLCNGELPKAKAWVSEYHSGDDCARERTVSHKGVIEKWWTLVTQQGCTWKVTSSYQASYEAEAYAEANSILDCDDSNAFGKGFLKNDRHPVEATNGVYVEDSNGNSGTSALKSFVLNTPTNTSPCVGNGSVFSATSTAKGQAWIRSEAQASGRCHHLTPIVRTLIPALCP